MSTFLGEVFTAITPLLLNLVVVLIGGIITVAIMLLNKLKDLTIAKIGASNYNQARDVAIGLYYALEDDFKGMTASGAKKRTVMDNKLLSLFPTLTQIQLDAINKEIWNMVNAKVADSDLLNKEVNLNE